MPKCPAVPVLRLSVLRGRALPPLTDQISSRALVFSFVAVIPIDQPPGKETLRPFEMFVEVNIHVHVAKPFRIAACLVSLDVAAEPQRFPTDGPYHTHA